MPPRRDPNDTHGQSVIADEGRTLFFEKADETLGDIAVADEDEVESQCGDQIALGTPRMLSSRSWRRFSPVRK